MAGPHDAEVAAVQGRDLWLVEALGDSQNGGVHEPNIGIGVAIADVAYALIVLRVQVLDSVGAGKNIVEQGEEDAGVEPHLDPVIDLNENRGWNHKRLMRGFN